MDRKEFTKIAKIKGEKGITLLVLVITIIILLILAGITISAITGNNGIIKNAGQAKEETEIANEKEIVEKATVQAMGNNKYGNIVEDELQSELDKETGEGNTEVSIIRKKYIVQFSDSERMYRVDDNGNVYEYVYTELPIMENGLDFNSRMSEYKSSIFTVTVLDNINIPENTYQIFDVSKEQNGTVKAWLVPNEENIDMYDLYIGGYDGVQASGSCQNMFSDMEKVNSIDLEEFYTENTTNFGYMFQNCKNMEKIKLNNINTNKATYLGSMFGNCSKLKELDISHFDTKNVTVMSAMFSGCSNLQTIDLKNFDTSKVTSMNQMFRGCYYITELDLSSFDTSSLTRTDFMFSNNSNLKTIYVSNKWINDKITLSDRMFSSCTSLSGAISYDSTKTDITYANYETGYFTYKE